MNKIFFAFTSLVLFGFLGVAKADFVDNGDGLIYDTVQNITWLQQPNYSGINWFNATNWVSGLTQGGVTGWRLPKSTDTTINGYSNTKSGSELGRLYSEIASTTGVGPFSNLNPGFYWSGMTYYNQSSPSGAMAWINDLRDLNNFNGGDAFAVSKESVGYYTLAVHDGDVIPAPTSIPEPASVWLLVSSLICIVGLRMKNG